MGIFFERGQQTRKSDTHRAARHITDTEWLQAALGRVFISECGQCPQQQGPALHGAREHVQERGTLDSRTAAQPLPHRGCGSGPHAPSPPRGQATLPPRVPPEVLSSGCGRCSWVKWKEARGQSADTVAAPAAGSWARRAYQSWLSQPSSTCAAFGGAAFLAALARPSPPPPQASPPSLLSLFL